MSETSLAAAELRGRTPPWGRSALLLLAAFVAGGLWLRVNALAAEGFGDDEVHKWLAARRYLTGDIGGDDVEHPMLMKALIAVVLALAGERWAPEAITRLPNALAGGASVLVVALLARRLFGRAAALWASALAAASVTLVGYQRMAKEDTLLGLFLMMLCWCAAEAKAAADDGRAAAQARWEQGGAAALGAMLASKYFFFLTPIPLLVYGWIRGTNTTWRVPARRWLRLVGLAFLIWAGLDWTPFLPSTWEYARTYIPGGQTVHGSLFFMGHTYHNLVQYGPAGTPPWFYVVFTVVKLAPGTLLFALGGLAVALWHRQPAHRVVLAWMGVWFAVHSASGSKWGRFYISVLPAFLILAGHAAALALERARAWGGAPFLATASATGILLVGGEARAALTHAPHYRLYVSPLGGGDGNVPWFFPHCDFYDTGFRDAMQEVTARSERGAEVCSEIDWVSRLYAERAGRMDLVHTLLRRGRACRAAPFCYVLVQPGRVYLHNADALTRLSHRAPWHTVRVLGQEAVQVYRLPGGESPFPDDPMAAPIAR